MVLTTTNTTLKVFHSVNFVKLVNIVILKVLKYQQVIVKWDTIANRILLLLTLILRMQAATLVHAQRVTIALSQHGNRFRALLEPIQIQLS